MAEALLAVAADPTRRARAQLAGASTCAATGAARRPSPICARVLDSVAAASTAQAAVARDGVRARERHVCEAPARRHPVRTFAKSGGTHGSRRRDAAAQPARRRKRDPSTPPNCVRAMAPPPHPAAPGSDSARSGGHGGPDPQPRLGLPAMAARRRSATSISFTSWTTATRTWRGSCRRAARSSAATTSTPSAGVLPGPHGARSWSERWGGDCWRACVRRSASCAAPPPRATHLSRRGVVKSDRVRGRATRRASGVQSAAGCRRGSRGRGAPRRARWQSRRAAARRQHDPAQAHRRAAAGPCGALLARIRSCGSSGSAGPSLRRSNGWPSASACRTASSPFPLSRPACWPPSIAARRCCCRPPIAKASACRSPRPWPAARRSWPATCPRCARSAARGHLLPGRGRGPWAARGLGLLDERARRSRALAAAAQRGHRLGTALRLASRTRRRLSTVYREVLRCAAPRR